MANYSDNSLSVLDGGTGSLIATNPVGTNPPGIGVNPTTDRIYVANFNSNNVSVIEDRFSSAVSLTSVPNPSPFGQSVTFTATVTPMTATGTVTFTEGATVLGSGTINAGGVAHT